LKIEDVKKQQELLKKQKVRTPRLSACPALSARCGVERSAAVRRLLRPRS
jgi:hypothetical protein